MATKESTRPSNIIAKKNKLVEMYDSCYFRMGEMEMATGNKAKSERYSTKIVEKQDKNENVWERFCLSLRNNNV